MVFARLKVELDCTFRQDTKIVLCVLSLMEIRSKAEYRTLRHMPVKYNFSNLKYICRLFVAWAFFVPAIIFVRLDLSPTVFRGGAIIE